MQHSVSILTLCGSCFVVCSQLKWSERAERVLYYLLMELTEEDGMTKGIKTSLSLGITFTFFFKGIFIQFCSQSAFLRGGVEYKVLCEWPLILSLILNLAKVPVTNPSLPICFCGLDMWDRITQWPRNYMPRTQYPEGASASGCLVTSTSFYFLQGLCINYNELILHFCPT